MLEFLGLKPLLNLKMRLGEGTGAALGISLAEAAVKLLSHMATFGEAGVSDIETPEGKGA
jgi:nicotinate-nucleotide--dimethylbenzimidazole phosphoribosyltransferase